MGTETLTLSDFEYNMFYYTAIVGSCLSILGSLPLIIFFRRIKRSLNLAKFLYHQSVAAILFAISVFLTLHRQEGWICPVAGLIGDWAQNSSIMWAANIAIYMYYKTVKNSDLIDIKYKKIARFSYFLTSLVAILRIGRAYIPKEFGDYQCGGVIPTSHYNDILDFVGHYLFLIIFSFVILYCYIKTYRFLNALGIEDTGIWKYPFLFCFTWGSAALANLITHYSGFIFILQYLRIFMTRSVGLFNALLYRQQLVQAFTEKQDDRTESFTSADEDYERRLSFEEQHSFQQALHY